MSNHDDDAIQGEIVPAGADPANTDPAGADPMDLGGLLGGADGGGFDLGSMMEMAANVQQQVAEAQDRLVAARLEGTAGGGLVSVTLNGHLHLMVCTSTRLRATPMTPRCSRTSSGQRGRTPTSRLPASRPLLTRWAGWVPAAGSAACSVVAEWRPPTPQRSRS